MGAASVGAAAAAAAGRAAGAGVCAGATGVVEAVVAGDPVDGEAGRAGDGAAAPRGPGVAPPAGVAAGLDDPDVAGAGALPPVRSSAGKVSLMVRTTGGSMVDDADRTNSPFSFR